MQAFQLAVGVGPQAAAPTGCRLLRAYSETIKSPVLVSKSTMSGFPPRRLWRIATLTLVLATYVCSAEAQPQPRRTVLVVHWSPEEFPINPRRDAAIREVLLAPSETIDYFAEYLESDRCAGPKASEDPRHSHESKE